MPRVVIVGAGIVGCSAAAELVARGARVTLLDRGEVSAGTTGLGEGNVLCADKDAGPELDLTVAGRALYDELEARLGAAARIRRKGALIVHPLAATWAAEPARAERLRAAGVECELVDPAGVRALEPRLTGDVHGALHVPGDLQCDPQAIARALAREAAAGGAEVRTGVEVVAIEAGHGAPDASGAASGPGVRTLSTSAVANVRHPGRIAVRLADGTRLDADAVVLAAGPWSGPLAASAGLRLPLQPRKGQLLQLRVAEPDPLLLRRKVVDGSYLLSLTSDAPGAQLSTVVETTWDGHVVVGSSREFTGFDASVDGALGATMQARAARLVPAIADLPVARAWVGFRPWLPDHLPAIGASARVPGLFVGTGHEGAGVALGPITGRVLAQAIMGKTPVLDLAPFAPDRFS